MTLISSSITFLHFSSFATSSNFYGSQAIKATPHDAKNSFNDRYFLGGDSGEPEVGLGGGKIISSTHGGFFSSSSTINDLSKFSFSNLHSFNS